MRYYVVLLLVLICSCTTTKYVEVPVEKVRTEYVDKIKYDSIYSQDSIYIREKGDTIFKDSYKYLYKYKYIKDTLNTTDTITVTKPVEVEKEINKLYTWQILLMVMGGGLLGFLAYKLIRKIKEWI